MEKSEIKDENFYIEKFANLGNCVQNGKNRIYKFLQTRHSQKENISYIKREYGIGGFSTKVEKQPDSICAGEWGNGNLYFEYYTEDLCVKKINLTWEKLVNTICYLIKQGKYL